MKPKTSPIWNYFDEIGDSSAKCKLCEKVYSRKGRTTTALKSHLKSIHAERFAEFEKLNDAVKLSSETKKQMSDPLFNASTSIGTLIEQSVKKQLSNAAANSKEQCLDVQGHSQQQPATVQGDSDQTETRKSVNNNTIHEDTLALEKSRKDSEDFDFCMKLEPGHSADLPSRDEYSQEFDVCVKTESVDHVDDHDESNTLPAGDDQNIHHKKSKTTNPESTGKAGWMYEMESRRVAAEEMMSRAAESMARAAVLNAEAAQTAANAAQTAANASQTAANASQTAANASQTAANAAMIAAEATRLQTQFQAEYSYIRAQLSGFIKRNNGSPS